MRRALLLSLIAAAAGAACPAAAASSADADADRVFDDLETRLAGKGAGDRVGVIVTVEGTASKARVEQLEDAVGDLAVTRRFSVIPAFAAEATGSQVRALARQPNVAHVEANRTIRALNDTAQASYGVTKARIDASVDGNADGAAATYSKDDLVAAVLDTGIDASHQDLDEGKVIAYADCTPLATCTTGAASDDEGHGTHVAGILAGDGDARPDQRYKGVAPGAALVGVKVLNAAGSGSLEDLLAGIDWVLANRSTHGIEAINLSLGSEGCGDGTEADSVALQQAAAAGLVVAVAAGNEGPGTCTVGPPGDAKGDVLTVGSMADLGAPDPASEPEGFFQDFGSSRGPTDDGRVKPDISAPGVDITSANGNPVTSNLTDYETFSGTSMASPFALGVALLMLDTNPALTPAQIKQKVVQTAVDWGRGGNNLLTGSTGTDVDYGAGRLDAYAAIASAGAAISAPPVAPAHFFLQGTVPGTDQFVDFDLAVTDLSFPVAATLIVPGFDEDEGLPDFDLHLFAPGSAEPVARSERGTFFDSGRQEEVFHRPTTPGTYKLRVLSFEGAGGFFLDVSGGSAASAASPSVAGSASSGTGTVVTPGGPGGAANRRDSRAARLLLALSRRGNRVLRRRAIVVRFRPDETVRADFAASIAVPGSSRTFRLRSISRTIPAGRRVAVRLRVARRVRRAIARAFTRGRRVSAVVRVGAVDGAGNRSSVRKRIRLRR
jgi:serine protease AprX